MFDRVKASYESCPPLYRKHTRTRATLQTEGGCEGSAAARRHAPQARKGRPDSFTANWPSITPIRPHRCANCTRQESVNSRPLKSALMLMTPRSEVDRLLADTGEYTGKIPKPDEAR